jgi:hypothetical protein
MKFPSYIELFSSNDLSTYKFLSMGPNGEIWKVVQFQHTGTAEIYNLGFGDLDKATGFNDVSVSDNGDRDKILATVAKIAISYTERYPDRKLIFLGSTASRTRLYRMAINKAYEELNHTFVIEGVLETGHGGWLREPFRSEGKYDAFLFHRRSVIEYSNPPP